MVDIIIPAYNAHKTIDKTLFSIAYQKNIEDIKVYIVDDCSNKDYSEEIQFFRDFMNIRQLRLPKNGGPGVARQFGVDNSSSKYIIFIDADDQFASPTAIETLYNKIEETSADVVISSFSEVFDNGLCVEHENDKVWLHGKIYRRKFLEKNKIRFNSTYANEDNGFNQLIFLNDSKVEEIYDYTYLWIANDYSITRRNDYSYSFNGLFGYIYNMTWAIKKGIETKCDKVKISELAFDTIVAIYYYYLKFFEDKQAIKLLKQSKELYDIFKDYQFLSEEKKQEILYIQFCDFNDQVKNILNPPITFDEFLSKLDKIKEKKEYDRYYNFST